jgi:hypothetical protein
VIGRSQVDDALRRAGELFEADGVRLELVDLDEGGARIEVRVDLGGVDCLDCVLPPEVVAELVSSALVSHLGTPALVVQVDDPRTVETVGAPQEGQR